MKALLAIDGSSESALALETSASLTWPVGARLEVLTVLPTEAEWYGGPWTVGVAYVPMPTSGTACGTTERPRLSMRPPGRDGPASDRTRSVEGRAASVIVDVAEEIGPTSSSSAREVTARSNEHSSAPYPLRSLTNALLGPVARRPSAGRILIGTDGSDVAVGDRLRRRIEAVRGIRNGVINAVDLDPSWWMGFTPGDRVRGRSHFGRR